jgi:hypothetical protein
MATRTIRKTQTVRVRRPGGGTVPVRVTTEVRITRR